jgi:hypothetical protein
MKWWVCREVEVASVDTTSRIRMMWGNLTSLQQQPITILILVRSIRQMFVKIYEHSNSAGCKAGMITLYDILFFATSVVQAALLRWIGEAYNRRCTSLKICRKFWNYQEDSIHRHHARIWLLNRQPSSVRTRVAEKLQVAIVAADALPPGSRRISLRHHGRVPQCWPALHYASTVSANFDLATPNSDGFRGRTSSSTRFVKVKIHNGAIAGS